MAQLPCIGLSWPLTKPPFGSCAIYFHHGVSFTTLCECTNCCSCMQLKGLKRAVVTSFILGMYWRALGCRTSTNLDIPRQIGDMIKHNLNTPSRMCLHPARSSMIKQYSFKYLPVMSSYNVLSVHDMCEMWRKCASKLKHQLLFGKSKGLVQYLAHLSPHDAT